jgi:hypothetical protein
MSKRAMLSIDKSEAMWHARWRPFVNLTSKIYKGHNHKQF